MERGAVGVGAGTGRALGSTSKQCRKVSAGCSSCSRNRVLDRLEMSECLEFHRLLEESSVNISTGSAMMMSSEELMLMRQTPLLLTAHCSTFSLQLNVHVQTVLRRRGGARPGPANTRAEAERSCRKRRGRA